jgi:hypothetical protein
MTRWGNEAWGFPPDRGEPISRNDEVAVFKAQVDVDIILAKLHFNEQLSADQIRTALEEASLGLTIVKPWPPKQCTDANRFRLMALMKMYFALSTAEVLGGEWASNRPHRSNDAVEAPREWAYKQFPEARLAREAGGGPYRICTFQMSINHFGRPAHDYDIEDGGIILPCLRTDLDMMIFVRSLLITDLARRCEALVR